MSEQKTDAGLFRRSTRELPPPDVADPVIDAYKKDVDRTLLRENLKLSVEQRFRRFESFMDGVYSLRAAGERMRAAQRKGMQQND